MRRLRGTGALLCVVVLGPALLLGGCSGTDNDGARESPRPTVPPRGQALDLTTEFPATLVALPDGGLLVGELATGRILKVPAEPQVDPAIEPGFGRADVLVTLPVAPDGGFPLQVGLTGLATDPPGGRVFAAWVRADDDRMVVSEVVGGSTRDVWIGPMAATQASAGRLVWWRGRLVVSIGDRLQSRTADPPLDDLRSALVSLDPDGSPSQQPIIVSTDWNNPFAVTVDSSDRLLVADNVPKGGPERLGVTTEPGSTTLSELGSEGEHLAPAGIAEVRPGVAWICGWITGLVTELPIGTDGRARWADRTELADVPCSLDVVVLVDGRIAVSTDSGVRVVRP